jgi:hypothetical protein
MMSPAPPPSPTRDTDGVVRHELWLAVVALLALLAGAWAFGAFLRDEVSALANRVFLELGLTGLAALFLVSETIVSPCRPTRSSCWSRAVTWRPSGGGPSCCSG